MDQHSSALWAAGILAPVSDLAADSVAELAGSH
jgi:hypothetical protein